MPIYPLKLHESNLPGQGSGLAFNGGIMKRLQGKVAVVTGGNSGIGLASAQRLKEEGAKVAITGRSQKTLDEAVKLLGSDILAIQSDVSKELHRFVKRLLAAPGDRHLCALFLQALRAGQSDSAVPSRDHRYFSL